MKMGGKKKIIKTTTTRRVTGGAGVNKKYLPLALLATIGWFGGGAYWYTCKLQKVCETKKTATAVVKQTPTPTPTPTPAPAPAPKPAVVTPSVANPGIQQVFFSPDSASFLDSADSNAKINKITEYLKANANATVKITGFTATAPSALDTISLGQNRADAVKAVFINAGIAASRITTDTKGNTNPVGDNATASGQSQNRRADIVAN
jgi:outer membrane protein OmpA-like peptidoglycan-associated protein